MNDQSHSSTQFVTWILVVVGWIVVSEQQRLREIWKSDYQRLLSFRQLLKDVESKALNFHTQQFDFSDRRELLRLVSETTLEASYLRKTLHLKNDMSSLTSKLRRSITLNNFDENSHSTQDVASPLLEAIVESVELLDKFIYECMRDAGRVQVGLIRSFVSAAKKLW